jgi:hypothetical protein
MLISVLTLVIAFVARTLLQIEHILTLHKRWCRQPNGKPVDSLELCTGIYAATFLHHHRSSGCAPQFWALHDQLGRQPLLYHVRNDRIAARADGHLTDRLGRRACWCTPPRVGTDLLRGMARSETKQMTHPIIYVERRLVACFIQKVVNFSYIA